MKTLYVKLLTGALVPGAWLMLQFITFHFALYTSHSKTRSLLLPFLFLFTGLSLTAAKSLFFVPGLAIVWAQSLVLNVVHITEILYIHPVYRQDPQCNAVLSFPTSYRLWTNPRLLNFPRAEKDVDKDGEKREPLGPFLFLRLSKIALYYCLSAYIFPALFSETIVELLPEDIEQTALFGRLDEVTAREFLIRSYTAVEWIWKTIMHFDGANAILACLSVASGFDRPEDWPDLFGSPVHACGLRNFWARFWHQLAVRPFKGYGLVISHSLGLPPGSWSSKTLIALTIFLVSGLSHQLGSWAMGTRDWLDIQWYLLNFLGCSLEILVVSSVRNLAKRLGFAQSLQEIERSWLGYVVGYTWVYAFMFWSVPLYRWPRLHGHLTAIDRWMSILSKMVVLPPS